ncbi:MAG: hypothetical protein M3Q48_06055 [Actinomycetota bacterium]|nr:hypothetical protein [Actinomycetota bacterium]
MRVSVASDGAEANDARTSVGGMSADGRYVALTSHATNLVARDTNRMSDAFIRDRDADEDGVFDELGATRTERVAAASDGAQANNGSAAGEISADGRYVPSPVTPPTSCPSTPTTSATCSSTTATRGRRLGCRWPPAASRATPTAAPAHQVGDGVHPLALGP